MNRTLLGLSLLVSPLVAESVSAQRNGGGRAERPDRNGGPETEAVLEVPTEAGIAWFGTWEAGLAEAQRTGRPILVMSAAPQCQGVPGMW